MDIFDHGNFSRAIFFKIIFPEKKKKQRETSQHIMAWPRASRNGIGLKLPFMMKQSHSAKRSPSRTLSIPLEWKMFIRIGRLDSDVQIDNEHDASINTREYQRGTGKLQWLATKTCPDIANTACILAQFNSAPTRKCWNGVIHVIKYLKGSIDRKIIYRRGEAK